MRSVSKKTNVMKLNNLAVIIPSYNAKKTIVSAINGIRKTYPLATIIIVDDNSPDGTQDTIRKNFAHDKKVILIVRKAKGGRGSAVITGFKEALKDKHIDFFVEMDADLCHNPKYIHDLLKKCEIYDVAIASKYKSSSQILGQKKHREIFSRFVNWYIRISLNIPLSDFTNGYRCYKRSVLETVNLNKIQAKGFIVLSEILFYIYKEGFKIGEIPFVFQRYNITKSNFNKQEIYEAFYTTARLFKKRVKKL